MDMSLSKLQELVIDRKAGVLQSIGSQRVGCDWATGLNWTEEIYWDLPNLALFIRASQVVLVVKKRTHLPMSETRDAGLIPGLERSSRGGHSNPLQYSYLKNTMFRGAWWAIVHGVTKSWAWLKRLSTHAALFIHLQRWHHLSNCSDFRLEESKR